VSSWQPDNDLDEADAPGERPAWGQPGWLSAVARCDEAVAGAEQGGGPAGRVQAGQEAGEPGAERACLVDGDDGFVGQPWAAKLGALVCPLDPRVKLLTGVVVREREVVAFQVGCGTCAAAGARQQVRGG
jgi:hypothetical protein